MAKTSMDICMAAGLSVEESIIVIDICRRWSVPIDYALAILQKKAKPGRFGISADELENRLENLHK